MAFDVTLNKKDMRKFTAILTTIFEGFAYVPIKETEDKFTFKIGFLGEDEEKLCQLQENLMEHLDEVTIEEVIGGK